MRDYLSDSRGVVRAACVRLADRCRLRARFSGLGGGREIVVFWSMDAADPLELAAPLGDGRLELRAQRLDPVLRTLFVLALRDLRRKSREVESERRLTEAPAGCVPSLPGGAGHAPCSGELDSGR